MNTVNNLTIEQVRDLEPSYNQSFAGTLYVSESTIPGAANGCFAASAISNGTIIGTYAGYAHDHVQFSSEGKKRFSKIHSIYTLTFKSRHPANNSYSDYVTINGLYGGNELRYINDCSEHWGFGEENIDRNVAINSNAEVYAVSDINPDEELFLDYSLEYE